MVITSRYKFGHQLKSMGLTGTAAEIGVAEGDFSFALLDCWPGVCYQIDPWARQETPGYAWHGTEDQEGRYLRVLERAARYHGRASPMRATSIEAAKRFTDGELDFVYIDAIHTLESARQDIDLWFPKVKSGGILAGHDYLNGVFHGQDYGVKEAVNDFARAKGFIVNVIPDEWPSWWVVKA